MNIFRNLTGCHHSADAETKQAHKVQSTTTSTSSVCEPKINSKKDYFVFVIAGKDAPHFDALTLLIG